MRFLSAAVILSLALCQGSPAQTQSYGGLGLIGGPVTLSAPNDGSTGTTVNLLAKINSSGNAVLATTSDTAVPIYIVVSGAGTTGNASLAIGGLGVCQFDASGATAGHFVVASAATSGRCADAGATVPLSGWVIGQAQSAAGANATATVALSQGYNSVGSGFVYIGVLSGIPATCTVGQIAFITNASAGQNQYNCTATNTWVQNLNTGGGTLMFTGLGDYAVNNTSGTVQTIGALCSSSNPCSVGQGAVNVCVLTAPATATLSGTSVGGTNNAWWYCSSAGVLTVGHNTASTVSCSAGCSVATGITGFPADSTPIQNTTFTSLAWNGIVPATAEKRASLRNNPIAASSGISTTPDPTTGILSIATDPTIVPRWFKGSGSPNVGPLSCTQGRDFYTDTASPNNWFCSATNTWSQSNAAAQRTDVQNFSVAATGNGGTYSLVTSGALSQTWYTSGCAGPGTVINVKCAVGLGLLTSTDSWLYAEKKASHTWSAAAGTVDVIASIANNSGAPSAGNWNLNFYVGCAGVTNGTYTYGTVATVTAVPPSALGQSSTYAANGLNLPGSCAADSPMQFWIIRTADTGGTTGVSAVVFNLEVVIRGN